MLFGRSDSKLGCGFLHREAAPADSLALLPLRAASHRTEAATGGPGQAAVPTWSRKGRGALEMPPRAIPEVKFSTKARCSY